MKKLPALEKLRSLFDYDPETGTLTWKTNQPNRPPTAGRVAGKLSCSNQKLYRMVWVGSSWYMASRVIWKMQTGEDPWGFDVDHRDGDSQNDRWENLRKITRGGNCENIRRPYRNSKSGFLGVTQYRGRFKARIRVKGTYVYLGLFDTPEEAHRVYIKAKRELHPGNTL